MTSRKPPVRIAPLGELEAYVVYEHELDRLAEGSPASLLLNFALFLLGIAGSFLATLVTASLPDRLYYSFLIICVVGLIAGAVPLSLWWRLHQSTRVLVSGIKDRMPPK